MTTYNHHITKRDFLKKSLTFSAGMCCLPCHALISEMNFDPQGIYKRIAMYQEETARGIMCRICPNECVLKEGELSKCNNRKVHDSKLYTLEEAAIPFSSRFKSIFHCNSRMQPGLPELSELDHFTN